MCAPIVFWLLAQMFAPPRAKAADCWRIDEKTASEMRRPAALSATFAWLKRCLADRDAS
jgi:hypothetical protein